MLIFCLWAGTLPAFNLYFKLIVTIFGVFRLRSRHQCKQGEQTVRRFDWATVYYCLFFGFLAIHLLSVEISCYNYCLLAERIWNLLSSPLLQDDYCS